MVKQALPRGSHSDIVAACKEAGFKRLAPLKV
jgi:hypothetical protein